MPFFEMDLVYSWLPVLSNPDAVYLLMMLGFYALIFELASPGIGFGAVVGTVSLVLAFHATQALPLNYEGLALVVGGILLMALDMKITSHGFLTLGGLVGFMAGSSMLFAAPAPRVSPALIIGAGLATAGFFLFAVKKILQTKRIPPATGREAMIGEVGEVRAGGMVFVHGEYWSVDSARPLSPGDKVRVSAVNGNRLAVEKI